MFGEFDTGKTYSHPSSIDSLEVVDSETVWFINGCSKCLHYILTLYIYIYILLY